MPLLYVSRVTAWVCATSRLAPCISAYTIYIVTLGPKKRKHKVDLADGYAAFGAPMVTREDTRAYRGEQRFVSLGLVKGQIVVLVWADDVPESETNTESEPPIDFLPRG
jgi:hypothetical protein